MNHKKLKMISAMMIAVTIAVTSVSIVDPAQAASNAHWITKDGIKVGYVLANGKQAKGWQIIGKNLYYFNKKTGEMVKGRTVAKIPLKGSGKAYMTYDAAVKYECIKALEKMGVRGKSKKKQLRAAFLYVASFQYKNIHGAKKNPSQKTSKSMKKLGKKYAYNMLTTKRGNCYRFTCAFSALAREIGYKPKVVVGRINADHGDGHSKVVINGKWYDLTFYRLSKNERFYGTKLKSHRHPSYRESYRVSFAKCQGTGKIKKDSARVSKTGKLTTNVLIKRSGKHYYYDGEGRRIVPKDKVIKYKNKYYYFNKKGKNVKGLYYLRETLYDFKSKDQLGYHMTAEDCKTYRSKSQANVAFSELKTLIGTGTAKNLGASCLGEGSDWSHTYAHVVINTFVPSDGGPEIIVSIEAR